MTITNDHTCELEESTCKSSLALLCGMSKITLNDLSQSPLLIPLRYVKLSFLFFKNKPTAEETGIAVLRVAQAGIGFRPITCGIYLRKMKSLPVILVVVLIICLENSQLTVGVEEKSCRAIVQDITKIQMTLISQCFNAMNFKNAREKSKKMNCVLRCAMIEAELTNPEGQVTPESVDYLLNKYVPPSLSDKANATFFPCMEIGLREKFKTLDEDEFCMTYDPFLKCFVRRASSFCS